MFFGATRPRPRFGYIEDICAMTNIIFSVFLINRSLNLVSLLDVNFSFTPFRQPRPYSEILVKSLLMRFILPAFTTGSLPVCNTFFMPIFSPVVFIFGLYTYDVLKSLLRVILCRRYIMLSGYHVKKLAIYRLKNSFELVFFHTFVGRKIQSKLTYSIIFDQHGHTTYSSLRICILMITKCDINNCSVTNYRSC